jgi:Caspase domain/WD domain, G-beta repeat
VSVCAQPASPPLAAALAPSAEPLLRVEAGMHTAPIYHIDADAAGRWAVTASNDKTARVWDAASGRLAIVLRPPIGPGDEGKLFAVAISPDGAVVASGGWSGYSWNKQHQVYLFDRASGRLLQRLGGLPAPVNQLAFSPDGRYLAATLRHGGGLWVWDRQRVDAPMADREYGGASCYMAWSRDGRLATSADDGQLRLYSMQSGSLRHLSSLKAPGGQRPHSLAFSPDGARLAVGYQDKARVDLLDGHSLALLSTPATIFIPNSNLQAVAWSFDGQVLAAAGRADTAGRNVVLRWAFAGSGIPQLTPVQSFSVMNLASLPQGGWLLASTSPGWGYIALDRGGRALGLPPTADLRFSQGKAFQLADGGRVVQFGFRAGGADPHQFDLARRTLRPGSIAGGQLARTAGLDIASWTDQQNPTLDGKPLRLLPGETAHSLAIASDAGGFILGTDYRLRRFSADGAPVWLLPVPATVMGVNIADDGPQAGRMLVVAYVDGTIRWHRWSDGQELLALFVHADRKRWILWTPSGYYDASPGAEELIGWQLNRGQDDAADFFPASRFRSRFYRPDVIDRVLDTVDESAALRQADQAAQRQQQPGPSVAELLPPVVEVLSGAELDTAQDQVTVRMRVRSAADAPVTRWRVRVNGQLVPGARGATPVADPAAKDTRELVVAVPPQDSEIQVFAENRHGVSVPATVFVRRSGNAAAAATPVAQRQPKLYVLAVGVGSYAHKDIAALAYAAKDARDFAAAMQRQKGRLYGEVEVRLLTDTQATRDEIVDGLDWLQKQVTQHDVGMLFFAGHGLNDPALGYTFLPSNADPDRLKRTGVSMADVRSTLANLTGKALFFVDTCHAGNVLGAGRRRLANDISGLINELAGTENGVVVFSSSTGRQFSYENPAWNNGAFTLALVEGLNGAAAQADSPRITHKMLDYYISDRVKRLTDGKQTPVTQAPGGVPDFPVAVK